MNINISKAMKNEKDLFKNLLQLYMYDFTEFTDVDINVDGLYNIFSDFDSYWIDQKENQPYIVRVNDAIAGFVLIKEVKNEIRKYNYLAHFFIMRKYRRQGIGKEVAIKLFNSLQGEWELNQLERNKPAQKFWTKIINEYTNGNYKEKFENGRKYQTFFSK
ncbi:GNAT family N-acetyltransferase [Paenibacillus sp. 2TAF8]|jgi:predicted acetyltransferase|uniref:GNAT family N-acetyltransferase n=1 Tax=Paenibacillus sp. 2TAF8 TaxID=3233020 RepID=UPI003F9BDB91